MAVSAGFKDYLFDVLAPLGKIEMTRFFGLAGIKVEGQLIGFVRDEKIYFRSDAETQPSYVSEGCKPFAFDKQGELIVTSYYTIPDRLYDEPEELIEWARQAYETSLKTPTAMKKRQARSRKLAPAVPKKKQQHPRG